MYDDEPSSMSLELFGYHGVVVDGDHDGVDGATLHGGLQLAFDDNFKAGGCGPADYYSWTGYGGGGSGASSSSSSSVLSFEQAGSGGRHQLAYSTAGGDEDCAMWMDAAAGMVDHTAACNFGFVSPGGSVDHHASREIQEPAKPTQKRARPVGEVQVAGGKKQCSGSRKSKAKTAAPAPTKDPQSVAAKVRRERIAEKLKILQDLVPNGTKVDLVTMLEKAITYVKFLQLQVKVLAADEFWPAQGGKAPELSQVKDALDAILSSQYSNK
ncbi:hypothetical protein QOZ80_1BG0055630 [Eleusine coracana subsp. coracana]|nr:hypothetical protein QOZ80_1BG0055630 [Eleusine coracana subsp. coracana]